MKTKIKIKKKHIVLSIIFLIVFLIMFFLSTIVRIWLVKNSKEIIGRQIELKELHINYLKFSVEADNFLMYEQNQKDTFVSFQQLYVNFDPWHLLHNEYAFSEIKLINPTVSLIYSDTTFNFDDLLTSNDTIAKDTVDEANSDTVRYLVKNLVISGGYIKYEDKTVGNITEMKEFGVKVPEISWNSNQSKMGIDFILGENGKVSLGGNINQAAGSYAITLKTENIDIEPYQSYVKPYMDVSLMGGKLYSDMKLSGDMNNPMNVKIFGEAGIKDFVINDRNNKEFVAIKNILVKLDSLDIGQWNFCINTIELDNPRMTATLEKNGTNIDRILAPYFADTTATDTASSDTTVMHYSIDSLIIKGGQVAFADLSLRRPFHFDISNLEYIMSDFSDLACKIPMSFSMNLNKTGSFKGKTVIDMVNMSNIVFDGTIANLNLVSMSPYSEYYLARPITKGAFNYTCQLLMTPTLLDNKNKLKIVNIELGKKTKDTTAYKVPIGLALYILKDRNGIIGIDMPVSGNPSSPKFKLGKLIWKTLEELLLKACSEPFNAIGKMFGSSPESIKQIPFEFLQDSLTADQSGKLDKLAEIITKKPELTFTFIQTTDPEKEKELIAIKEAKGLFVASSMQSGAEVKNAAFIMDNDPAFLTYLGLTEKGIKDSLTETCMGKAGSENVENKFNQLLKKRELQMNNYLTSKNIPQGSVAFKINDLRNLPDEMKTPKFVIEITLK